MSPDLRGPGTSGDRASYETVVAEFEREVIRQTGREMSGQAAHVVHATLVERLRGRLPGVELDDGALRPIARAISEGTLRDLSGNTDRRP